jgi:hypothetical protein
MKTFKEMLITEEKQKKDDEEIILSRYKKGKPLDLSFLEITSLNGLPNDFNEKLIISHCSKLKSLIGLPKRFNSEILAIGSGLTSLKGLPDGFNSELDINRTLIKTFDGIPKSLEFYRIISDFKVEDALSMYKKAL